MTYGTILDYRPLIF